MTEALTYKYSVIIPMYNNERFIEKCLESVVCQTYRNMEIIVWDDGSTDNSFQLAEEYARKDPRIKLKQHENCGPGKTRNEALKIATGDFILFLDSDDYWLDESGLERINDVLERISCDIAGTYMNLLQENKIVRNALHEKIKADKEGVWVSFLEEQDCMFFHSYIYRRMFLLENEIFFTETYGFEDPVFLANALSVAQKYYLIPIDLYTYRFQYKEEAYMPPQKIRDMLEGTLAVMEIAKKNRCENLYAHMSYAFEYLWGRNVIGSLSEGHMDILMKVFQYCNLAGRREKEELHFKYIQESVKLKRKKDLEEFLDKANRFKIVVIFGAGIYGKLVLDTLIRSTFIGEILFAQTNEPAKSIVYGKKCKKIDVLLELKEKALIVIAVNQRYQDEIENQLINLGYLYIEKLKYELLYAISNHCKGE